MDMALSMEKEWTPFQSVESIYHLYDLDPEIV